MLGLRTIDIDSTPDVVGIGRKTTCPRKPSARSRSLCGISSLTCVRSDRAHRATPLRRDRASPFQSTRGLNDWPGVCASRPLLPIARAVGFCQRGTPDGDRSKGEGVGWGVAVAALASWTRRTRKAWWPAAIKRSACGLVIKKIFEYLGRGTDRNGDRTTPGSGSSDGFHQKNLYQGSTLGEAAYAASQPTCGRPKGESSAELADSQPRNRASRPDVFEVTAGR